MYAAGDALRGPATVVEGIADAAAFAEEVLGRAWETAIPAEAKPDRAACIAKKGVLCESAKREGDRCLSCDTVCQACADVCPNRANVVVELPDGRHQILHVDRMCNECGNCAVFCPYQEGRPYKDKLTLFWSEEDMENSENEGFLAVDEDHFKVRVAGTVRTVSVDAVNTGLPEAVRLTIRAVRDNYSYLLKK